MKIAVLGAGMVGSAIATDLSRAHDVTAFDVNEANLAALKLRTAGVATQVKDLKEYAGYGDMLADYAYVVTAVPGFMGFETLKAVIEAGKCVADLSFFPEDALTLDALAKEKGVTVITDCGVAPGMSNYIMGYYNTQMTIASFECRVGGLPVKRVKPYEYKAPFSPIDVIEEYTRPARMMENGQVVVKPALSDAELIEYPETGTLEAFNTDGLRSLLHTMRHIPNMKEKTLRYPGHIDFIKSLIKGGFFSTEPVNYKGQTIIPLEYSSAILLNQWKLLPGDDEFTIMEITLDGVENGAKRTVNYRLFDVTDRATQTTSMARTTGYTCTGSLELIMNGLFTSKGIFPPELVGCEQGCFHYIMEYLAARGVHYVVTTL